MNVTAIKTKKIQINNDLSKIITESIDTIDEYSIVAISSKIISLTQGAVVKKDSIKKYDLVMQEAELYTPKDENKYGASITINHGRMIGNAGIDDGNTNGYYSLWPKNLQKITNDLRSFLQERYTIQNLGVIITDSTSIPLQHGPIGIGLTYSGFVPFTTTNGENADVFGNTGSIVRHNILGGIAAAAVVVMGEGNEQTPITIISDIDFVRFVENNPSIDELQEMHIELENDLFHNIWQTANWIHNKK